MEAPLSSTIDVHFDAKETSAALRGRHILLVEDCVTQGRLYLKFLQSAGASVTLECNGEAAANAVRRSPDKFDAVVMDFQMPVMDGLEATKQLRKSGYHGAIVAATAFGTKELTAAWYEAGCDEVLEKPLTLLGLTVAILHHVSR